MMGRFCRIGRDFGIYLGVHINKKYRLAKDLLESGGIQRFEELVALLPYCTLAKDTSINHERMKRMLYSDVGEMELREMITIARVLDIDRNEFTCLVCEVLARQEANKKSK